MRIKNYTTSVSSQKTIMIIEEILVEFGAEGIYKTYQGNKVSSIMFYIMKEGQKIPFKIPMRLSKCRKIINLLVDAKKLPKRYLNEPLRSEQGERVAWRVIKDWIESQLTLFEIEFADSIEILLPYAYDATQDKTVYEKFLEKKENFIALELVDEEVAGQGE